MIMLSFKNLQYGGLFLWKSIDYYTDCGPIGFGQYNGQGVYCGLSTASEVFLIFTTQLYQYFSGFFSICTFR